MKIKNGKIVIIADTIEEARADLEMIEALSSIGAVSGQGSGVSGKAEIEMPSPLANDTPPCCCPCGCACCCDWDYEDEDEWDCDDEWGEDVYEEDDDVYDDEIIGDIDEEVLRAILRKMMGL